MRRVSTLVVLGFSTVLFGCGDGLQAVYPARPPASPGMPVADPTPSRVVVHATISGAALKKALDDQVPSTGGGTFPLLGGERKYSWQRVSTAVSFSRGRISLQAQVLAKVSLPLTELSFPIDLKVHAEPVVAADYRARLQSLEVDVSSTDPRLKLAQSAGGALDKIKEQIEEKLKDFTYDLRPILAEAHGRIAKPIDIPLGDAKGCAELRVTGVEAGPTVLADGVEKDLAVVIVPSVTLPCAAPPEPAPLPPLANVASVPSGPFTVTVPIAARYEELQKAMTLAFTDGKFFFSKEFPQLYLSTPEVYSSKDQIVVKLHLHGPVKKGSIKATLDGDLYMIGTPVIIDNELRVPDLEPTIETRDFLLKLAAAISGSAIRDSARSALRLDIGDRLKSVRSKLSSDLAFGDGQGCLKADVSKIAVTGVHAHAGYLRVYVSVTAQAGVYLPCPATTAPPPAPVAPPPPAVSAR